MIRRLKLLSIVALTLTMAPACRKAVDVTAAAPPGADDPRQALTRFITMLEHRDPALIDEFADDADVLVVGSEASEIASGRVEIAQLLKALTTGPAVRFEWKQTRSSSSGDIAWLFAAGDAVITDHGNETRLPYRLTGVLQRKNGAWKWRQFHGSEPAMH